MWLTFLGLTIAGWLSFLAVLFLLPRHLAATWDGIRGLRLPSRLMVWVAFLPWMIGLALWGSGWSASARRSLIAVLAVSWCIVTFQYSV